MPAFTGWSQTKKLALSFNMSDSSKPTPAEPEATGNLAKSFADRLSFPSDSKSPPKSSGSGTNPTATTFTPSKFNWADEVTTPVQETPDEKAESSEIKSEVSKAQTDGATDSLEMAQKDGATTWLNGSQGLDEPEFDVNVKLADLQDDPNNPLYSVKSFDQLNL